MKKTKSKVNENKENKDIKTFKLTWPVNYSKLDIGNRTAITDMFEDAAHVVVKEIEHHFEKDKWDISYTHLKEEVFYTAMGHHLENYLLRKLTASKKFDYTLIAGLKEGILVRATPKKGKSTNAKRKKVRQKKSV